MATMDEWWEAIRANGGKVIPWDEVGAACAAQLTALRQPRRPIRFLDDLETGFLPVWWTTAQALHGERNPRQTMGVTTIQLRHMRSQGMPSVCGALCDSDWMSTEPKSVAQAERGCRALS